MRFEVPVVAMRDKGQKVDDLSIDDASALDECTKRTLVRFFMSDVSSVTSLINLWPRRADLAEDVAAELGSEVTTGRVHRWAGTGVIPARYHAAVVRAGRARGFNIDADLIVRLHDPGAPAAEDAA